MGLLDELKSAPSTELGGTGSHFIDADTLKNPDGPNYRIQGIDSAEVAKVIGGGLKEGTAGGYESTQIISNLANSQGYTNVKPLFNPDGSPMMDTGGKRQMVDLTNDAGESFRQGLLNSGTFDINEHTTVQDIAGTEIAAARRNAAIQSGEYVDNEFDKAASLIMQAEEGAGAKALGFKETLLNEQARGDYISKFQSEGMSREDAIRETNKYFTTGTQIDNFDRDYNNNSNNPLTDSWEIGLNGAREGAFGFLELLGETTGSDYIEDVGTKGIERIQNKQAEYGHVLTDWKDVEGFKSGVSFLANNAAMSLPYMISTAGAVVAGTLAAPVIGVTAATGLAIAAPATIYAGQVWNEMEGEKSAGAALTAGLAQAALDRLGIGAITGKILPKNITGEAVKKIMKATGATKEVAEQTLANATKQELAGYLKDTAKLAADQIAKKKLGLELLKKTGVRFSTGAAGEAVTEAGQEAIGYLTATQFSDKQFDWGELNERLIAASIAGGSLGGGFAVPGGIKQALAEYDTQARHGLADPENESQSAVYAEQEKNELGYVPSNQENLARIHAEVAAGGQGFTINERKEAYEAKQKDRTFVDKATEAILNAPKLWRGATRSIFTPELQQSSRSARMLADMFGGNLQRIFSGANFESSKHHKVAKYKNMVPIPDQLYNAIGKGKRLTQTVKDEISNSLYDTINKAVDAEGNFDPNLIPEGENKQVIVAFKGQLDTLANQMYADQKKHNKDLGFIKNYLTKYKALNKKQVEKNRKGFESLLMKKHGYSAKDARDLVDVVLNNPNISDVSEAFSVVKGGINPSSHQKRTLNLSEDKDFAEFMEKDIFANISSAAKSSARYTAHREFIGENGAIVSKLLDNMQAEGVSQAEVDKVAAELQAYLDAESGNYKRPTTAAGKKFQQIQKNLMTFMTLSGLPLATVSSLVEIMLVNKGLNNEQIFGEKGSLKAIAKEGGKTLLQGTKAVAAFATRTESQAPNTEAQETLRDLGFYEWDVGAATVTGATEVTATQQERMKFFFQAIGLTQWTDYTRAVRGSLAADYLFEKADIVWAYQEGKGEYTREVQEAQESLRNLGIDVDQFAAIQTKQTAGIPLTPEEEVYFGDTMREATYNFINEAIALPGAANRPLIYQDPRFALFTQFQGFIATFTANHIPKMWGEYVKRGTPAMKYNAFATAVTMIMMGFLSQHVKDFVKYGPDEDDFERKTGLNPYLDTAGYIRRGIQSSGIIGSAERVLNFLDPVYESHSSGVADWTFNSAVGESPALGWLERATGAAGSLVRGDVGRATTQGLKAAPFFGPFSIINKKAGDYAANWNFNGE